jgi:hypothetical protein
MPTIELSDETFGLLKGQAEPLVDTPDTVVRRALMALQAATSGAPSGAVLTFTATAPPNLTHTRVLSARVGEKTYPKNECYWNYVLFDLARLAGLAKMAPEKIQELVAVNAVVGEKSDSGYRYISEAGISIQGQDANGAWKGIRSLGMSLGQMVEVTFDWANNSKAANPGRTGKITL